MIILVTGAIGSGKTHHTIRMELLSALRDGRNVLTNIDGLEPRRVAQYLGCKDSKSYMDVLNRLHVVDDDYLLRVCQLHTITGEGLEIPTKSTVIVDEAQMVWNSREFKKTGKAFIDLLAYSRHHDINFVFMTQHEKLLEVVVTRLANQFQRCENLGFLGALAAKGYRVKYSRGVADAPDYSTVYHYDIPVFSLYKSSKVPESLRFGKMPWQVWAALICALCLFGSIVSKYKKTHFYEARHPEKRTEQALGATFAPLPATSIPPVSSTAPVSNVGAVLEAIKALEAKELRNSPNSGGDLADLADAPPPYHVSMHGGNLSYPSKDSYVMKHTTFH